MRSCKLTTACSYDYLINLKTVSLAPDSMTTLT